MRNVAATDGVIVGEVVRRLSATYRPCRVYLYGSAARGDAGPDSDLDFLVVVPDDAPARLLSAKAAYEALWGMKVAADVLVWREGAFQRRLSVSTSLPSVVAQEGILLYAS